MQLICLWRTKWESRRVLQRAITEQLDLPARVMELFDWQDEEDDLHGVKQDSRVEIPRVLEAMYDHIHKLNHRFLIIFQNGSSEEINLSIFGFPLSGYSRNKVLWTFQGRFRLFPRLKVDGAMTITKATDVFLSASQHEKDPQELRSYLVHQEAVESAPRNQPSQVAEYFLYMWNLCCMSISTPTAETTGYVMASSYNTSYDSKERETTLQLLVMMMMNCGMLLVLCSVRCDWTWTTTTIVTTNLCLHT